MTLIVKLRLMPRKTSILGILLTFFPINSQCFQYRLPNLWQPKQSCCNTLPSPSLSGCNGKDRFNEDKPCTNNFLVLQVILRRSQMLSTFSRDKVICIMYLVLYPVLKIHAKGILSYSHKEKNQVKQ